MTTATDTRIGSDGQLQHRSEIQGRTFTGFCSCEPADLSSPISKKLAIVSNGDQMQMFWLSNDGQSEAVDNLKTYVRGETGTANFLNVYVTNAPTLVG